MQALQTTIFSAECAEPYIACRVWDKIGDDMNSEAVAKAYGGSLEMRSCKSPSPGKQPTKDIRLKALLYASS